MTEEKQLRGWFATIAHDDPLISKYGLDDTYRCRLFRSERLPMFEVRANGEHLCFLDPRDVLFAFGADRVSFLWDDDRTGFASELSSLLQEHASFTGNAKVAAKTGIGVLAAASLAAAVLLARKLLLR